MIKIIRICILFWVFFLLFSCDNNSIIETPTTEETPKEEVYNPFHKDDLDSVNYDENMLLSDLIYFEKIDNLYISSLDYRVKEEMSISLYDIFSDALMIKYNKTDNLNKYTNEYYFSMKDIIKNIKITLKCNDNIDSFYIGNSGYLYYFLDDFYYKSQAQNFNELIIEYTDSNHFDIKKLSDFISLDGTVKMMFEENNIDVILDESFIEILNSMHLVLYKDYYIYNFNIEEFISNKCKDGIKLFINDICINISKEGNVYINDNNNNVYICYNLGMNYYEIMRNYLDGNSMSEEYINVELLDFNNAQSIDIYSKDGYKVVKNYSYDNLNDILNIFNDVKMIKYSNDNEYYSVISDVLQEIKVVIDNEHIFYVGASGFVYYFTPDCYYKSLSPINRSLLKQSINYPFKDFKTVKEHLSSVKLDIVSVNIYEKNTNGVVYTIPIEILDDFASYFSDVELFFIGGVIDGSSSTESYIDEIYFFKDDVTTGYVIEFVYANNKKNYINIDLDGRIYYSSSNTYMSVVNDIQYYTIINDYLIKVK